MAVHGGSKHYRLAEIRRRHFLATAQRCGLGAGMEAILADVIERTPSVIETVSSNLPPGFPEQLFESVTAGLARAARELATAREA